MLEAFENVNIPCLISMITAWITFLYYAFKHKGLPPGPTGLPYLGYWPFFVSKTCHLQLDKMKNKYGELFSFTCLGRLYINLGSIKSLREAHVTRADCFTERFTGYSLMADVFKHSVLCSNGEDWKAQRKFYLQFMKERTFKFMREAAAGSWEDHMSSIVNRLREKEGELVNIFELLVNSCTENIKLALFGDNGSMSEQIGEICHHYSKSFEGLTPKNLLLIGTFARRVILPLNSDFRKCKEHERRAKDILREIIKDHKSTFDCENQRDVIDAYFKERENRTAMGDPTASFFTDEALCSSLFQFLGDGVVGVAGVLSGIILLLVNHPEEQDRIHEELMEVIGQDRLPCVEDKPRLSYTNAFMLEALRVVDTFPFMTGLECTKETTLQGYRIPKGAITLMNTYSCHCDPETYDDPEKFDPSRFLLIEEGKKKAELPITFGVGKRSCLGESFTMTEIFLTLTTILKHYRLTLAFEKKMSFLDLMTSGNLEVFAVPRSAK